MANNKTTNQPGSNDKQPHGEQTRHTDARDTSKNRPNGERTMTNADKSKQGPEDDFSNMSKAELADERGGHGHSGHSNSRNGSRKKQ